MAKRTKPQPLSDQLRKLILEHELSRYAICKAAAVDPGQMHRFIKGTGRLTTDSLGTAYRLREWHNDAHKTD